ncbi:hypothetical protein GCM10017673_39090 [Streptosporangium violaceochromogenes]|nr:hypothetical protein GCM10017673_39090 [Streptosporangium violaceochromogenes]
MRNLTGAAQAVASAAGRRGILLRDQVAEEIARAVLDTSEGTVTVTDRCGREAWAIEDTRNRLRRSLRNRLMEQLADDGRLPVGAPAETRRYYTWAGRLSLLPDEVPADQAEAERAPWDDVVVELAVGWRSVTEKGSTS